MAKQITILTESDFIDEAVPACIAGECERVTCKDEIYVHNSHFWGDICASVDFWNHGSVFVDVFVRHPEWGSATVLPITEFSNGADALDAINAALIKWQME